MKHLKPLWCIFPSEFSEGAMYKAGYLVGGIIAAWMIGSD